MKNFSLFQMVGLLTMVITIASCGFTQPVYDEDYSDRGTMRRQVYDDPYYNNNRTTVVRDPYTGQYYEVRPVGSDVYYPGASVYGNGYPSRRAAYPSRNSRVYSDRNNSRNSNNNTYNRNTNTSTQNTRPQEQAPASNSGSRKIDEARDVINGRSN